MENNEPTEMVLAKLDSAQLLLESKQKEFAAYLDEVKRHEENVKALKEQLYERMLEQELTFIKTDHFKITLTKPHTRHTYDMKALQATNPKLYKQVDDLVGKDTPIKGYVKIGTK